jgi:D-proline reductase (dithiol) PrdB|tara:strand:- start:50 stop:442 length:393 start_codon:yes stop_codon:yes gene_type:complete
VSLIARHLEANGVPTVIMGCAKDLVEYCGAPRFLFSDFPLGNAAGKPNNPDSQAFTLELAMKVLETAPGPRTTVQSPLRWNADGRWKLDFSNIDQETPEELAARKKAFDEVKEVAKKRREQDGLKVHAAE